MELFDVMRSTFAARDYTGEELTEEILYKILDNARFAPSGGNRQGNRIIIIRNEDMRNELSRLAEPAAQRYGAQTNIGENPWNTIVPTQLTPDEIADTSPPKILTEPCKTASVVLVFLVDLSLVASMDQNLDRIGIISGASIYPFVWNVLLAARHEGFGGTITTLAVANEPELKKLLKVPDNFAICAIVPLGKPRKQLTKLRRRSVAEIATLDIFDGKPFSF